MAASKDSLGDVLSTGAVLVSILCNLCFGWSIDGWIGLLVSGIVLKAGYEVCKDTVDSLLGGRPDLEKIHQLRELLLSQVGIMGIHDLVLHDYGPGRCFASVRAEVDANGNILEIHELVDDAEREIGHKMNMPICIHMDPIVTDNDESNRMRDSIRAFLQERYDTLSMHDFCMVPDENHAHSIDPRYCLVVTFDTDYT